MSHYAGHIREAFLAWIEAGRPQVATIEVNYEPREIPAVDLLGMVWHCTDIMPRDYCIELDFESGSTYAQAAQALRRSFA